MIEVRFSPFGDALELFSYGLDYLSNSIELSDIASGLDIYGDYVKALNRANIAVSAADAFADGQ